MLCALSIFQADMAMGWVDPWVGLGRVFFKYDLLPYSP